jgi:2-polyprenyl-6-methoxyphenol hydroxylase-like FAD-dependent oxidoreductase
MADVAVLVEAFRDFYKENSSQALEHYSGVCLRRVWKAQRFSWWMTSLLHRFEDHSSFDRRPDRGTLPEQLVSVRRSKHGPARPFVCHWSGTSKLSRQNFWLDG